MMDTTKVKSFWSIIKEDGAAQAARWIDTRRDKSLRFYLTDVMLKAPLAQYLLGKWKRNRELDRTIVDRAKELISSNNFGYLAGFSVIHVDTQGYLIDIMSVPEILQAVVETNGTIYYHIHLGTDRVTLEGWYNRIIRRNETEEKSTEKVEEPTKLKYEMPCTHQMVMYIMAFENDTIGKQIAGKGKFTREDAEKWVRAHPSKEILADFFREGNNVSRASESFMTASEWGALRYITAKEDLSASTMFFLAIKNNLPLSEDDPIEVLKRKFKAQHVYATHRATIRMATAIIAWRLFRDKTTRKDIVWTEDQEFPKVN